MEFPPLVPETSASANSATSASFPPCATGSPARVRHPNRRWRKATAVIPAQAGIQPIASEEPEIQRFGGADWTPACAGVTVPILSSGLSKAC